MPADHRPRQRRCLWAATRICPLAAIRLGPWPSQSVSNRSRLPACEVAADRRLCPAGRAMRSFCAITLCADVHAESTHPGVFASAAIAAQTSGGSYLISAAIQHEPLAAAAGRGSGREIDLVDSIPRPGLGSWNCAGQLCWSHKDGRSTGAGVGRGVPGRQYAGGCQAVPGRSGMTWVRKAASCSTSSPSGQRKIR